MKPEWEKDGQENGYIDALKKERAKRYRETHKEQIAEYRNKYMQTYKRDPAKKAADNVKYRAKRKASMSEDELEAFRKYERDRKREQRARKKALEPPKAPTPARTRPNKYPDPSAGFAEAVADTAVHEGVVILHGQVVDFNNAWASADADLRERIITQLPSATDQELLDAYCLLHEERYGEPFDF